VNRRRAWTRQWGCLTICLTVVGVASAISAVSAGGSPRSLEYAATRVPCSPLSLGVHVDLGYEAGAARRANIMAAAKTVLRAQIARSTLLWDRIEPVKGTRDWSVADAVVHDSFSAGIEPLLVLMGSPSWANGAAPSLDMHQLHVPTGRQAFDTWLAEFASFAHDAALRYRGMVRRWEIWNEPNLATFWRPQPNIGRYLEAFQTVRAAILAADPTARVAVGGLSALRVAWGKGNIAGLSFLSGLILRGLRPSFVAVHPYTTPPHAPESEIAGQDNFTDIARIHVLLLRYSIRSSIWVTEWGWSSRRVGLERQAAYVQRSLEIIRDRYPYVTVATYFIDHDRLPRFYEGLLDASLHPKPAATRFAAFAANLERCRSSRKCNVGKNDGIASTASPRGLLPSRSVRARVFSHDC